jgi:hypothetical protein
VRQLSAILVALLLYSAPIHAQDSLSLHLSLAAYMALQGSDLAVTMYGLGGQGTPGLREANPIFMPLIDHPVAAGALKMGLAAGSSWILLSQHTKHPRVTLITSLCLNSMMSWVVYHNATITGHR